MALLNAELVNYRLDDHGSKLERLLENDQEFNRAISEIQENTRMITENLKQQGERLKDLEDDRKEKNYLKSVLTTWPPIIFRMLIACAVVLSVVNWTKVQAIISHAAR